MRGSIRRSPASSLVMTESVIPADDGGVIDRVLHGDIDLYRVLVERHESHVFSIVAHRVPAGEVESVAHDVFVEAYRSLPSFSGRKPFRNWLSRIAVRCCCDYWRRTGRMREFPASTLGARERDWIEEASSAISRENFERAASRAAAAEVLEWALSRMSVEDRMAVDLLYLQGWSVRETADALGWSVANTKVRAMRARHRLRKAIGEALEEADRETQEKD